MYDCCCQEFKWLALTQFFIYPLIHPLIHPLFTPCSPYCKGLAHENCP